MDLAEQVAVWGHLHEFGDMTWLPHQRKVFYRKDDRVDVSTPGDGLNDYLFLRPYAKLGVVAARIAGKLASLSYMLHMHTHGKQRTKRINLSIDLLCGCMG